MFLASGGCWTSLWLHERQIGYSTAGAVRKRPEMSDRAFVYGAIIVGTLAISLDFASVDLASVGTRRAIRISIWQVSSGSSTVMSSRSRF